MLQKPAIQKSDDTATNETVNEAGYQVGVKFDTGKTRFELLPPRALMQVAEVYTHGAEKYAPRNWEKGMEWGRVYGATQRHLQKFWSGQDLDEESALPHLAHAAFGILALLEYAETHPELDDRFVKTDGDA
jgi:hypothetical protein